MIADALSGKIDLIITKSVSRFARNTVDSLTTVRQLKDAGIEIYFEKENIWTLDSKGELLITIMSSLAQEESRSISENVTWGQRKRMADGKVSFAYSRFMGLDKDKETGKIVVNPEQAEVVRLIFRMFLEGLMLIMQIAISDIGMTDNFNLTFLLTLQSLLITGLGKIQPGSLAFPTHRRIIRENIKNNHVPGIIGKSLQVHIRMSMIFFGTCLYSHFFH